jgi:hypothetical protein
MSQQEKSGKNLINYLGGDSVAGVKLQAFDPKHTLVSAETFDHYLLTAVGLLRYLRAEGCKNLFGYT